MYRLAYNGEVVAFKMGRRQGTSRTGTKAANLSMKNTRAAELELLNGRPDRKS
jgi:hypothetical protein